ELAAQEVHAAELRGEGGEPCVRLLAGEDGERQLEPLGGRVVPALVDVGVAERRESVGRGMAVAFLLVQLDRPLEVSARGGDARAAERHLPGALEERRL